MAREDSTRATRRAGVQPRRLWSTPRSIAAPTSAPCRGPLPYESRRDSRSLRLVRPPSRHLEASGCPVAPLWQQRCQHRPFPRMNRRVSGSWDSCSTVCLARSIHGHPRAAIPPGSQAGPNGRRQPLLSSRERNGVQSHSARGDRADLGSATPPHGCPGASAGGTRRSFGIGVLFRSACSGSCLGRGGSLPRVTPVVLDQAVLGPGRRARVARSSGERRGRSGRHGRRQSGEARLRARGVGAPGRPTRRR